MSLNANKDECLPLNIRATRSTPIQAQTLFNMFTRRSTAALNQILLIAFGQKLDAGCRVEEEEEEEEAEPEHMEFGTLLDDCNSWWSHPGDDVMCHNRLHGDLIVGGSCCCSLLAGIDCMDRLIEAHTQNCPVER